MLQRANALVSAYQSLGRAGAAGPRSCAQDLSDIAGGLVEIFGCTVGSLALSLDLQPLLLAGERRRVLLLAASELVVNALRHALAGRQAALLAMKAILTQEEAAFHGKFVQLGSDLEFTPSQHRSLTRRSCWEVRPTTR
jgi:two-component sensor histidine kinase